MAEFDYFNLKYETTSDKEVKLIDASTAKIPLDC